MLSRMTGQTMNNEDHWKMSSMKKKPIGEIPLPRCNENLNQLRNHLHSGGVSGSQASNESRQIQEYTFLHEYWNFLSLKKSSSLWRELAGLMTPMKVVTLMNLPKRNQNVAHFPLSRLVESQVHYDTPLFISTDCFSYPCQALELKCLFHLIIRPLLLIKSTVPPPSLHHQFSPTSY